MERANRFRLAILGAAIVSVGALVSIPFAISEANEPATSPYGDRPEELDLENVYRLPAVYADALNITKDGNTVSGTFTAWNDDDEIVGNLQYRIEVYGDLPGHESDDAQVLFARSDAFEIKSLVPGERRIENFSYELPALPEGTYAVQIQILHGRARMLGWNRQNVTVKAAEAANTFFPLYGNGIILPEFEGKSVAALSGPNVDPSSEFTLQNAVVNGGAETTLVPVLRVYTMNEAQEMVAEMKFDPMTIGEGETVFTLPVNAPSKPGVYVGSLTLTKDGKTVSSIGEFRWVVRGADGDIISARMANVPVKKGEDAFIRIEHVGSADAETKATGSMEVVISDADGVVGKTSFGDLTLSDGVGMGTAKVTLERDLTSSPTLTVTLRDAQGEVLAVNENEITLTDEQLAQAATLSAASLQREWMFKPAGVAMAVGIVAIVLIAAYAAYALWKRGMNADTFRRGAGAVVTIAMIFAQTQSALAYGGSNGIEVFAPITVGENENYISGNKAAYRQYWGGIYSSPIVALFINQPVHNGTYNCSGSISLSFRVDFAACNNIPSGGRVMARLDFSGQKQYSLEGSNANWQTVYNETYYQPASCSSLACVHSKTFNTTVNLAQLPANVLQTTLQVIVKHNAYIDAAHGIPDSTIDRNDIYFQRRFVQAFNVWLMCQARCGNGVIEAGEQCDDGNQNNADACNNSCQPNQGLIIRKVATQSSVVAGQPINYTVFVKNPNNFTVQATPIVYDQPGPNQTITSVPSFCSVTNNLITCTVGWLTAGQEISIPITVQTAPGTQCPGTVHNTATLYVGSVKHGEASASVNVTCAPRCGDGVVNPGEQCDDGNTNNDDGCTNQCTIPAPKADVTISKSGPSAINRGDTASYSLIVKNNGPSTAQNVTVTDAIPAGLTYIDAQSDSRCNQSGNNVVCSLGDMTNQQQTAIGLVFQSSDVTACGILTNVASVSTTTQETNTNNNQASFQTNVICASSSRSSSVQSSSRSSSVSSVPQNGCIEVIKYAYDVNNNPLNTVPQFTFTLDGSRTAMNDSTGRAFFQNVTPGSHNVQESVPAGWTLVSVTPANGNVTVTSGSNCAQVIFINRQNPVVSSSRSSSVQSSSLSSSVPSSSIPSSSRSSTPMGCIDITKETFDANGNIVTPVIPFTFVLDNNQTVVNDGNGLARFNNVPAGTHVISEILPSGWTQVLVTPSNGVVNVPVGGNCVSVNFKNRMIASSSASSASSNGNPNLTVQKDGPGTVQNGDVLQYTITVRNTGNAAAQNVVVRDTFPSGLSFIQNQSTAGCNLTTNNVVACNAITLNAGQTQTYTLSFQTTAGQTPCGQIRNQADVTSTNASSTWDDAYTTVNCAASSMSSSSVSSSQSFGCIEITKTAYDVNNNPLYTVPQFTFTLDGSRTALNDSNGRARFDNVSVGTHTVIESVPSGWTLTTVSPNNGTVNVNGSSSCAQVFFSNRQNNITPDIDFSISKTDHESEVEPGDDLTYEIRVRNNANVTVTNVTVTDTLPDEVVFDSCSDNCSRNGRTITWNNLTFGPNEEKKFEIDVEVDDDADGTLINNAYVFNKSARDETDVEEVDNEEDDDDKDIELIKESNTSEVFPGGVIEYTVRIENTGDVTLEDLTVTDRLPNGVSIMDAAGGDRDGNELVWEIDELEDGDTWSKTYRVAANTSLMPGTILRNEVCVEDGDEDIDECEGTTVSVIGNLPQTGFGQNGSALKLRAIKRTRGSSDTNLPPLAVLVSIVGLGVGAGGLGGKKFLGL